MNPVAPEKTVEGSVVPSHNPMEHPAPAAGISMPEIVKLDENRFQIGSIIVDRKAQSISINGKVNMASGMVEYIACTAYGKLHESVLVLDAEPYHIQVALLLLGLKPGDHPIDFQGASQKPCGAPVRILVSWQAEGKSHEYPLETVLFYNKLQHVMESTDWVFTGSKFLNGEYQAQVEGSIIAIYHDPVAIIDHRSDTGTDDTLYQVNHLVVPPVGTPVVVKIYPVTDPAVIAGTRCEN
nr:YdjY domain-containing protein [uncultured Desulfobacter sp.]